TKFPSNETELGVLSTEYVKEEDVTTISEERGSELSTGHLESVGTVINTESPESTTLAELEKFSEFEIRTNDSTGTTNSGAIGGGETATILETVSIAHESEYKTVASDVKKIDASAEETQSMDSVDETLRSDISTEVTEGKMESGEEFTSQDIKPSEVISERVNTLIEEEETNNPVSVTYEPEKSIEFKSDTIIDEIPFTEEVNSEQTSGFSEEIKSEVTGAGSTLVSMVEADNSETSNEGFTTKGVSTDGTILSYTPADVTKNEEMSNLPPDTKSEGSITNPETTETESEVTPPFQIDKIIQSSDIVTLEKSDETQGSVASTTVKEQDLATEIVTMAVNLTAQSLDVLEFGSVEAVPESTSSTETTATTKVGESGDSRLASEIDYKTTDSNSIKENVITPEIIKVSSTEISNSSSSYPEDVDKLLSSSAESTTSSEESSMHGVFDGSSVSTNSVLDEIDETKFKGETEGSDSTTWSTLLSKSEIELLNTETVSASANESTVITEGSQIMIIDDEKVVTVEPKPGEKIRLTAATDLVTENREFTDKFMETTTDKVMASEKSEIGIKPTSESEFTDLDITQETSLNVKVTETTTSKVEELTPTNDDTRPKQSSSTEPIPSGDDLSTASFIVPDGISTVISDAEYETNNTFMSEDRVTKMESFEPDEVKHVEFIKSGETIAEVVSSTESKEDKSLSSVFSDSTSAATAEKTGSLVTESNFDGGEVSMTAEISEEILVTGEPKSTGVATEEFVSTETEANDNIEQLITDSKVTQIEDIESIEGNTSTGSIHITETVGTAFSSDEQSTKSTISEIEGMVTSSYKVVTTYERFTESKSTIFDEKPTGASSTESDASELTSSSESVLETEVSSMFVNPITADEFNKIGGANSFVEATGGFERSEYISTSSNIELTSSSETEAIAENSATGETTPTVKTYSETISTAIDKKLTISSDEIGYELDSSLETETASDNNRETTFKDLGEKSAE
ncbi:unnamed protein product, partial [Hymenolepis diminuta]|uniref:CSPG2 protein n=1 Tax=Hymenolepis diminuta TaxID=6216 RepID=A0A0R3SZD9_HYMDI